MMRLLKMGLLLSFFLVTLNTEIAALGFSLRGPQPGAQNTRFLFLGELMGSKPRITFGFVPMPLEIWDDKIEMSMGEFRLLGYLIRRVQFGKSVEKIPDREVVQGVGLSVNTLISARIGLAEKGFLKIHEDGVKKGHICSYEVLLFKSSEVDDKTDFNRQTLTVKSSEVDDYQPPKSSEVDDKTTAYKGIDLKTESKTEAQGPLSLEIARAVLVELRVSDIEGKLACILSDQAKFELKEGTPPETIIENMIQARRKHIETVPRSDLIQQVGKFFGEGKWKHFVPKKAPKTKTLAEQYEEMAKR